MNEKILVLFAFGFYCFVQLVILKAVVRVLGRAHLSWRRASLGGAATSCIQVLLLRGLSGSCYTAVLEVSALSFFVYGVVIYLVSDRERRMEFNTDSRHMLAGQALVCVILNSLFLYLWS
jgi:hypothetical protein